MSFCRLSREGELSDIHCYRNGKAIEINVAARRVWVGDKADLTVEEILKARREEINLPQAGKSYTVDTEEEAIEKLLELREAGFYVPESGLSRLRSAASEAAFYKSQQSNFREEAR